MIFGYTKVSPYLGYYIIYSVDICLCCNLVRAAVVKDYVNHFNKSSLKAVTW